MAYQNMSDKPKKQESKEGMPGGPIISVKYKSVVDPLEIKPRDKVVERKREKTIQVEDVKYKAKMRKDKNQ